MMLLALLSAVAVASAAEPIESNTAYNYHEIIGIPAARRIQLAESAIDFDGSRIIGGSPSSLGDQPHLGGLILNLLDGRRSVCGSSLLSHTLAVTAAHCWYDGNNRASSVVVVLGSPTLFYGGTRISSSHYRLHERWSWNPVRNDIALITLPHVEFTDNIRPISIISGDDKFVGTWATVAGYGLTSDSQSGISITAVKNQVQLQVIDNAECTRVFGRSVIGSTICTSGEGSVGACRGDSGGPLAIGSGDDRVLIGVVSFGSRRCEAGLPTAYSRITAFYGWIQARL